jgi:PBP1b-binding outer membrane lipoprotein LpoB
MMMSKFLIAATAATFALAGGVAMAQQDNNNPAPSYGRVSPVQSKNVQQIQDGINVAPRYSAVTPAKAQNVQHIQDGNNPAPRYQAATGASSTAPTGAHATAKRRATHG